MERFITLKEWLELVNYRITEGSEYYDSTYGVGLWEFNSWNGKHNDGGWSTCVVFQMGVNDGSEPPVREVTVHDYTHNTAYRLVDPQYRTQKLDDRNAWDGVDYVDLETVDDFIAKAQAIISGQNYDRRVSIPLEISDSEFNRIASMAHEHDITFNQMVERILRQMIDRADHNV